MVYDKNHNLTSIECPDESENELVVLHHNWKNTANITENKFPDI